MTATTSDQTEEFDATELGAMMREMRENLGHDLEKVAEDLHIRLVYLEAIETGRLSDLPGNAYVSGFLRAYSDYLGLDGEEIVRRFKMAGADISSKTQLHLPSPVEEGRLPTALVLLVAAVIAAGAYGGWYYLSAQDGDPMETVAKLPDELSGLVEGAANQTAPAPAQAQPETPAVTQSPAIPETPEGQSTAAAPAATETPRPAEAADAASNAATAATETQETGASPAAETASTAVTETVTANTGPTPITPEKPRIDEEPITPETAAENTPPPASDPLQTAAAPAESAPSANEAPAPTATAETPAPAPSATPAAPSAPVTETAGAATPAPTPETAAAEPEPPTQTAAATPEPAEPASRILPGDAGDVVRIVVRATADSYVAVRTSNNEPLFSQLMRPGDSYEVPSGIDLLLETGNAGGLQITVGGKRVPPLGPTGQVRRNIPLDAERLLSGVN